MAGDVNNGIGMSGIDLFAQIVPVRVLGECGGTDEDVFEGMLWASGVPIAGVPANPYPAKVLNMSLGGAGSCPSAVQDAIDDALAQGSVVVVAAGNESSDAMDFAPSGCSGVITVAASNRQGDITFYSNFGRRIDIAAPGGDFDDGGIISLSNDGQTVPANDAYANEIGTSASAPHVAGVVSMMLARDPTLTAGRVLSILQGTAHDFPLGSVCRNGNVCGAGILDAGLAMASTIPGGLAPPAGSAQVVEYYRKDLDHYYYTADPAEIYFIDTQSERLEQAHRLLLLRLGRPGLCAARRAAGLQVLRQPRGVHRLVLLHVGPGRVRVRRGDLARYLDARQPGGVLGDAGRGRRQLSGGDARDVPLRQQPPGLQPAPHDRPFGAPRDDQPLVAAIRQGQERRRLLHADLTFAIASRTTAGGAIRRPFV